MRLLGKWSFRTIDENFTEHTGNYEKADDDLRYVVSSYEVTNYLKRSHKFSVVSANKMKIASKSVHSVLKKIITMLPTMKYFGIVLFVIMRKD